jgi:hypothetical protein
LNTLGEAYPALHAKHAVAPETVEYMPAAHNVQLALPAWEYMPGGHRSTVDTPLEVVSTPPMPPLEVQVTPASADWNMVSDVVVAAANFLKSGEAVTHNQGCDPAPARVVHVTPLSVDIITLP